MCIQRWCLLLLLVQVSAIYFENAENQVKATAHVWTKSQFSAPQTVKSILEGACYLNFTGLGEVSSQHEASVVWMLLRS